MSNLYKYKRTPHLPWSEGVTNDDKIQYDLTNFEGEEIVISEKMDGENCLDGDSMIITEDGNMSIKNICDENYLGKVASFNIDENDVEFKNIVAHNILEISTTDEWYEIELYDGTNLKLTSEHYVYLPLLNVYRKVCDLLPDDEILFLP